MKHSKKLLALTLITSAAISGCATIIGSPTQTMALSSTPGDANVLITDQKGVEVFKGTTPTTVTLNKSDGSYWGKQNYVVTISKPGFKSQTIPIKANANGWYIGGNFILGGLIGWFIVDPLNGDMYTLTPKAVSASLGNEETAGNVLTEDSIRVVMLQDVPADLRTQMQRVGS